MVKKSPKFQKSSVKGLIQVLVSALISTTILLISAGKLDWWAAWAYFSTWVIGLTGFIIGVKFFNPDKIVVFNLADEKGADVKDWDKKILELYYPLPLMMLFIAGLDARFSWSQMPLILQIIGYVTTIVLHIIPFWAMSENKFHFKHTAIKKGQKVCTTGPYKYIRHPTYTAAFTGLTVPLLLGSWLALIPGFLMVVIFVIKTELEDRTLKTELKGYKGYSKKVRFKLIPGFW
jgi:protein-S-isoprenylcysteine O-methyltransferase Ste14